MLGMAEQASDALIEYMTGGAPTATEIMRHDRKILLGQLGYNVAPMLERMLIESVVLAWMRYNDELTIVQAEFRERRLSAAQRRYLRAVETLARIRRLALPALQVNIADKQVNLAGR